MTSFEAIDLFTKRGQSIEQRVKFDGGYYTKHIDIPNGSPVIIVTGWRWSWKYLKTNVQYFPFYTEDKVYIIL